MILPNDVSLNPGPTGPSLHSSFSSSSSFDSSIAFENCNHISSHFDLGSDDKGLRIGHWNVNRLSSEVLIGKSGVWAAYKKARNKAVGMLRNIKHKFYVSKLEQNGNDAKGTWKIIKSTSGMVKQSKRVNSL